MRPFLSRELRNRITISLPLKAICSALIGLIALLSWGSQAHAINCTAQMDAADELICKSAALKSANRDLDAAYEQILNQAPDDEIRSTLVASQKRWREALDLAVRMVEQETRPPSDELVEEDDAGTPETFTLRGLQSRIQDLTSRRDGVPTLIAKALQQRHFNSQFSGGKFAGYQSYCNFLPPDYNYYSCFATQHYQNGTRVCSRQEDWASGSVYERRFVADVIDGKPKLIASCTFNGNDTSCLGEGANTMNWNLNPQPRKDLYPANPLPKLDPEIENDEGDWLQACLTIPAFPRIDRSGSTDGK